MSAADSTNGSSLEKVEKLEVTLLRVRNGDVVFASDDRGLVHDLRERVEERGAAYEMTTYKLDDVKAAVEVLIEADRLGTSKLAPKRAPHTLVPLSLVREAEELITRPQRLDASDPAAAQELKMRDLLGAIVSAIQRNDLAG